MFKNDMKLPNFPWQKFEDALNRAIEKKTVYNLATVEKWINERRKRYEFRSFSGYIYGYDVSDLYGYSIMVINEMTKRGYKIKNLENHNNFFEQYRFLYDEKKPFKNHHNDEYLLICFWNLREKYIRGQKDFDEETWNKLNDFIIKEMKGGFK
jgi:uncharacterized protein (TIGR02328 family)